MGIKPDIIKHKPRAYVSLGSRHQLTLI